MGSLPFSQEGGFFRRKAKMNFTDIYIPKSIKILFNFLGTIDGCTPTAANLTDETLPGWAIQIQFSENKKGWHALMLLLRIFSYHNIEFVPYVFGGDPYITFGFHSNTKSTIEVVEILQDERPLALQ